MTWAEAGLAAATLNTKTTQILLNYVEFTHKILGWILLLKMDKTLAHPNTAVDSIYPIFSDIYPILLNIYPVFVDIHWK